MRPDRSHEPVLLEASLSALEVRAEGVYVDATFGRGGHSQAILARLGACGRLLAFDQDPEAAVAAADLLGDDSRFEFEACNFSFLGERLRARGLIGACDGILFDLGVSSPQLDQAGRGFSFARSGPLDMRMDSRGGMTAAQWLAETPLNEMIRVLRQYGEEPKAGRIARAIVAARAEQAITDTLSLANLVERAVGGRRGSRIHPATRTFQAIRIAVNRELDVLAEVLPQALAALRPGGRLAVISFHSLEDRIVKQFMRDQVRPAAPDPISPAPPPRLRGMSRHLSDVIEAQQNPRARSAVLRWAEKCA